jgi:hypothetical protein
MRDEPEHIKGSFSPEFLCKASEDLQEEIENFIRVFQLPEALKKAIDDLNWLVILIEKDPAKYVGGAGSYNDEVAELLSSVSWDQYNLAELARNKVRSMSDEEFQTARVGKEIQPNTPYIVEGNIKDEEITDTQAD